MQGERRRRGGDDRIGGDHRETEGLLDSTRRAPSVARSLTSATSLEIELDLEVRSSFSGFQSTLLYPLADCCSEIYTSHLTSELPPSVLS